MANGAFLGYKNKPQQGSEPLNNFKIQGSETLTASYVVVTITRAALSFPQVGIACVYIEKGRVLGLCMLK